MAEAAQRCTARLSRWGHSPPVQEDTSEVGECVVILASPRSGTTLFHRLLSRDSERFRPLLLPESILPSPRWGRALAPRVDGGQQGARRPLTFAREWVDKQLFGTWSHIHRVSFAEPEEDEWLWMRMGYSPAWHLLYGDPRLLPEMDDVDGLPKAERERLQAGFRAMLVALRSVEGPGRTLLMKNTLNAGRLETVHAMIPDARYVQLVRDPVESVASFVSMFHAVIRLHLPDVEADSPQMRRLADIGVDMLLRIDAFLLSLPDKQRTWVRYDDLVADPVSAVEQVYDHFGWSVGPAFADVLLEQRRAQRQHQSRHRYTPEDFGLDAAEIYARTEALCERFGFGDASALRSETVR